MWGGIEVIDFIDKTSEKSGTPVNRSRLMAIQGFEVKSTVFNEDGSILETNSDGHTLLTEFGDDGSITETFTGEKVLKKKTTFNSDGSIKEELV